MKKNRLKFWKNQPIQFGFGFISLKLKKPNQTQTKKIRKKTRAKQKKTQAKPEKTEPVGLNWFFSKITEPNQNRSVWIGFEFFLKLVLIIIFLIKTEPNKK